VTEIKCMATRFGTDDRCDRPAGHTGQHGIGKTLKWGGRMRLSTAPKVKPLPAGKPLAPYSVPAVLASKFADCPGQLAMDFSRGEWDALTEG
jgi:hypothetical protein